MPSRKAEGALLAFAGGTFHTALLVGTVVIVTYRGGGLAFLLAGGPLAGTGIFAALWLTVVGLTALGLHLAGWPLIDQPPNRSAIVSVAVGLGACFAAVVAAVAVSPLLIPFALPVGAIVGLALAVVDLIVLDLAQQLARGTATARKVYQDREPERWKAGRQTKGP